jgi:hypothetical protein
LLFGQWCVADGEGVAAVVAGDVEDEVVDVTGDEFDVEALATAREPPKPTPSAPAPTAVAMMILPSLVFIVSVSFAVGGSWTQENHGGCDPPAALLSPRYEWPARPADRNVPRGAPVAGPVPILATGPHQAGDAAWR